MKSKEKLAVCRCPFGGNIKDDCFECIFTEEYHHVRGRCILRSEADNPEEEVIKAPKSSRIIKYIRIIKALISVKSRFL